MRNFAPLILNTNEAPLFNAKLSLNKANVSGVGGNLLGKGIQSVGRACTYADTCICGHTDICPPASGKFSCVIIECVTFTNVFCW